MLIWDSNQQTLWSQALLTNHYSIIAPIRIVSNPQSIPGISEQVANKDLKSWTDSRFRLVNHVHRPWEIFLQAIRAWARTVMTHMINIQKRLKTEKRWSLIMSWGFTDPGNCVIPAAMTGHYGRHRVSVYLNHILELLVSVILLACLQCRVLFRLIIPVYSKLFQWKEINCFPDQLVIALFNAPRNYVQRPASRPRCSKQKMTITTE